MRNPASELRRLVYVESRQGQFVTHAEQALDLNPNNTMVLVWLGLNFTQSGQLV